MALANQLSIPYRESLPAPTRYCLVFGKPGLSLQDNQHPEYGQLHIDYLQGRLGYRLQHASRNNEALARAVGYKRNKPLKIIDATAGLGRDAMILAQLGCNVIMLERNLALYSLIMDATQRYLASIKNKLLIDILHFDAKDYLHNRCGLDETGKSINVIYLDPMYPGRSKSALVKKEMRMLRDLVGKDDDAAELLEIALQVAPKVVVKRPKIAPPIFGPSPIGNLLSHHTRFDIYKGSLG